MQRPWVIDLHHTRREGNSCADFLAKPGAKRVERIHIWESPPPGRGHLIQADTMGSTHHRLLFCYYFHCIKQKATIRANFICFFYFFFLIEKRVNYISPHLYPKHICI
jgi:hypothetical protein